jgi:subtilisin family serine protease
MSRRFLVLLAALSLVATLLAPMGVAVAEQDDGAAADVPVSETGSYIVVMADDPLLATEGRDAVLRGQSQRRARQLEASHDAALEAVGAGADAKVNEYTVALNGFSAILDHEEAERLAARKDVKLVMPDELRQPQTDASPAYLGLTGPGNAHRRGVTGHNVVVGIIDTGIWPEHPSFADDGTYGRPPITGLPCEFGNTAHNADDAPFRCNRKLLGARQVLETYREVIGAEDFEFDSARDENGHGTHVASTAAGNANVPASLFGRSYGNVTGIAPRALIVAYKGLGDLGGFTSDLAAAIDQAVADGVDVINYSIGGGASLTGADDIAFLFAADAGVLVATSAGNSGPGASTVGGPGAVPWITTVGANTQRRSFEGTVTLGDGAVHRGVSVTEGTAGDAPIVDAADAGSVLCIPGELDEDVVAGAIVLCERGVIARVAKGEAVAQAGGVGMVMYEVTDAGDLHSDNHVVPSVHVYRSAGDEIRAYIQSADEPVARIEAGGTGVFDAAPSMTQFSSRGPNPVAASIIKPDITAPGIQILAGASPVNQPGGQLFQAIAGTSMSSPHVAGVFALMRQIHPDWSPAMVRSALMTTANPDVRDNDRVSQASPFAMGAGEVSPGQPQRLGSAWQPGLVYDADLYSYFGFLCEAEPTIFVNAEATCGAVSDLGYPTEAVDLNLPSIGVAELAGTQTITRTVTSVGGGRRLYRPVVEAPEGFDVSVSPRSFWIAPGEEVTYTVTMTNRSAPVGEWRFGSLTWRDLTGQYTVRSPIAVRGALFRAPAEVRGAGESGSVQFPISFGYTGDYTAAGHGLEPADVTSDTVVQDPDQSFDPNDGFSNAHPVEVSGAAHLRIAMPPEATHPNADLDIFVQAPDGRIVASSTRAGTDEQVDIAFPADGEWTVWVHGWAAPGGAVDYDLFTWVISATPGGTLTVERAPESAVLGASGTVEASWTDADAGRWHLGAVSHSDAGGPIGLTFVEVDNR